MSRLHWVVFLLAKDNENMFSPIKRPKDQLATMDTYTSAIHQQSAKPPDRPLHRRRLMGILSRVGRMIAGLDHEIYELSG